MEDAI
jgi:hypothetical protein